MGVPQNLTIELLCDWTIPLLSVCIYIHIWRKQAHWFENMHFNANSKTIYSSQDMEAI